MSRVLSIVSLIWILFFLQATLSAPLTVDITDPLRHRRSHEGHVSRIRSAEVEANSQISRMSAVLENHEHPANRALIRKAFGKNANIPAIKENVQRLKTGRLEVNKINDHETDGAAADKGEQNVQFGPDYHGRHRNNKDRAGTLIHEASHVLFGTFDAFTKTDPPVGLTGRAKFTRHKYSGRHDGDFSHLRDKHSEIMHMNADSYKIFGNVAKYGFHAPLAQKERYGGAWKAVGSVSSESLRSSTSSNKSRNPSPHRDKGEGSSSGRDHRHSRPVERAPVKTQMPRSKTRSPPRNRKNSISSSMIVHPPGSRKNSISSSMIVHPGSRSTSPQGSIKSSGSRPPSSQGSINPHVSTSLQPKGGKLRKKPPQKGAESAVVKTSRARNVLRKPRP